MCKIKTISINLYPQNQVKMLCRGGLSSACVNMCKMCKNETKKKKKGDLLQCQNHIEHVR